MGESERASVCERSRHTSGVRPVRKCGLLGRQYRCRVLMAHADVCVCVCVYMTSYVVKGFSSTAPSLSLRARTRDDDDDDDVLYLCTSPARATPPQDAAGHMRRIITFRDSLHVEFSLLFIDKPVLYYITYYIIQQPGTNYKPQTQ